MQSIEQLCTHSHGNSLCRPKRKSSLPRASQTRAGFEPVRRRSLPKFGDKGLQTIFSQLGNKSVTSGVLNFIEAVCIVFCFYTRKYNVSLQMTTTTLKLPLYLVIPSILSYPIAR